MRCKEVAVCAGPTLSDPTMLHATSAGPLASGHANIRGLDRGAGPGRDREHRAAQGLPIPSYSQLFGETPSDHPIGPGQVRSILLQGSSIVMSPLVDER